MTNETETTSCPVHGHGLVNVHKVRNEHRVVIAKTCPEPRCQFVQAVTGATSVELARAAS